MLRALTPDDLQASTPPSSWYLSPEVAELEKLAIFHRNWLVRLTHSPSTHYSLAHHEQLTYVDLAHNLKFHLSPAPVRTVLASLSLPMTLCR